MRRRELITLSGGAVASWPLLASAQPALPTIGFLSSRSVADSTALVTAFHRGLGDSGFVENQNIAVEYRWADGQYDRRPALAADLVRRRVALLVTAGGEPSALAAKAATSTIPIVFTIGGDPVKIGLVESLNRPGGNATGVSLLTTAPESKRLELLHELVPSARLVGVLINPNPRRGRSARRRHGCAAASTSRSPGTTLNWARPSPRWCGSGWMPCWSAPTRSSIPGPTG